MIDLTKLKEDLHTELKESKSSLSKDLWETYSSFANTDGGVIYLGIKEGKKGENIITGVDNVDKQKKELFDQLNDRTKVSLDLISENDVETVQVKPGVYVLKINVPKANTFQRPIYINGQRKYTYRRRFSADYQCSQEQIESMDLKRSFSLRDSEINEMNFDLSAVDKDALSILKKLIGVFKQNDDLINIPNEVLLSRLGLLLLNDGKYVLSNAGVLLLTSAVNIQRIYPRYFLDYQENITNSSKWDYRFDTDELSNSGNMLEFYYSVYHSLLKGLPNRFELKDGINIGGKNMEEVIREALINCLCNCDFILGGIKIVKEPGKITFSNIGELNLDIQQALKGGVTNPRNSQIHTVFRKLGMVDKSGTGIPKIFTNCKKENLPTPVLFNDFNNNRTLLTIYTTPTDTSPKINESDSKIFDLILNSPAGLSKKEIMDTLSFSSTKTYNSLKRLINAGKVKTNNKSTNELRYLPNVE